MRLPETLNDTVRILKIHPGPLRFLLIGSINTALDLSLFMLFANIFGVYAVFASILSTGITLIFSFFMNHHFVFKSQKRRRNTLIAFITVTLFNVWIIQSSVIYVVLHSIEATGMLKDHLWTLNLVAKLCGVAVSTILNYFSYKSIFKEKNNDQQ